MPQVATQWTRFREGLTHAFAVRHEPLSDQQRQLLRSLALEVQRRRLDPAVAAGVELFRPLAGVASHSVTFFEPLLTAVVPQEQLDDVRDLLKHPDAVDVFQNFLGQQLVPEECDAKDAEQSAREATV